MRSSAASSSCRAFPSPTIFPAPTCRCIGNLWDAYRQEDAEEGPRQIRQTSIRWLCRRALHRARGALWALREDLRVCGRRTASRCRRSSSSSATTRRRRSSSTTTSPASSATRGRHVDSREGRLALFRNYDGYGNRLPRPRTLLIDSEQLESGEALDKDFREMAAAEIDRFRREIIERTGDSRAADTISDQDLAARGHEHGRQEGPAWRIDPLRRFGLDADRGVGRQHCHASFSACAPSARSSSASRSSGARFAVSPTISMRRVCFNVEYADVLGVPFDFAAKPVVAPPSRRHARRSSSRPCGRSATRWRSVFPRVEGYRVELPEERLEAKFGPDSVLQSDAGPRRSFEDEEPGHHRRGRRSHARASQGDAALDDPLPSRDAPALPEIPRPRRGSRSCISSASSSASRGNGSTAAI